MQVGARQENEERLREPCAKRTSVYCEWGFMETLISVLMGVYYRDSDTTFLERSIRSMLGQTMTNIEVLLCDDGSSHEAQSFLKNLSKSDCRLKLIRGKGLYSLPEKLNACLAASCGELIARMDDDDFSHPQRLQRQVEYLQEHPEISFVGCNAALFRNGIQVGIRKFPAQPTIRDFYFTQPYLHPALMFRRDALLAVSGYSESKNCRLCEDYDLLLRLYEAGFQGANMEDILLDYSLPTTAKGNRRMNHRWNEAITRYRHFQTLHLLPAAFPWVIKPLIVGLLPERLLFQLKYKNGVE